MTLAFYKYEFELTSLKPIKENINTSEKILNKILFQIEKAEEKIKNLNLAGIFKKDMKFLITYSHEKFIPLIIQLEDIINSTEGSFQEEIIEFNNHLKQNFEKFHEFLKEIIEKTPEIIGPFEKFDELNRNLIPEIYNLLDKLRNIFEEILPEIDEKIFHMYSEQIRPIHEITDKRREKKLEFKNFKNEIEQFTASIENNVSRPKIIKPKTIKQKKIKSKRIENAKNEHIESKLSSEYEIKLDKIQELKTEYLQSIDRLDKFINLSEIENLEIDIVTIIMFKGNMDNLNKYLNEAFVIVKEINIFLKELNFGIIFQEDLDLLNDIFYDYFNPLLKLITEISERNKAIVFEEFKEFVEKFKANIISTQDKLKEVIDCSIEPLKKIDINLDLVLTPFSDIKNSTKKILVKTGHISREVKNIWKYVLNIARIISDKYLGELKSMNDELLIYNNKLNESVS